MTASPEKELPTRTKDAVASGAVEAFPRDDFDRNVWCVLGVPIDMADIEVAVGAIDAAARERRPLSFVTPNVNWLVRAANDKGARRQMLNADLSLADGAPLALAARLLGAPLKGRVAGSDVFEALRRRPPFSNRRLRVFFFGGRDGAAQAAHDALGRSGGGLAPAGWLNPGFGDVASMSTDEIIGAINDADADFVVVALGAAKGQAWIDANHARLTAPVIAHLGAVVDFTAGTIARAPHWVAASGLEWAWRIGQEPALWRRYFLDAIGLARIGMFRLLPQILAGRSRAAAASTVKLERLGGRTFIRLSGDFVGASIQPVRAAFRKAASYGAPVALDLGELGSVDGAFLGLVLMLEKSLPEDALEIAAASQRARKLLAVNGMKYPAAPMAPSFSGEEDAGAQAAAI
ncbi:MAG: WecB/TagA/CpsF family glycosyltransferase [Parvularculaceae bacterium]